jgi:D-arabinose 1-dehydrogenase-like Zn-dependent alcohol dehydrogenase
LPPFRSVPPSLTHARVFAHSRSHTTQIGKALGARVIGTVGSAEKVEVAKKAGCDEVRAWAVLSADLGSR